MILSLAYLICWGYQNLLNKWTFSLKQHFQYYNWLFLIMMSTLFRNISNIKGRGEVFYLLTIRINHPVILFISSWTSFLVLLFCCSYICLACTYWIGGFLKFCFVFISSVQLSHSVMCDSLWSHELQHTRLPCPSPTPGAYSNSCPSSQWCHPTISSSVSPFSCP